MANPGQENKTSGIEIALDTVGIADILDIRINPSTEEKQDDILVELQDLASHNTIIAFFSNPTLGTSMELANPGFTGTPEMIHDGTDTTAWTGVNLGGVTFNSTTHAKQGIVTVIQFGNLSGAIITIEGTNITNSVLTEGVEWTAVTSNDATATSIASAIDAVTGVSATATGAVVQVIADNTVVEADITTLSTDAVSGDMTATARSVDATASIDGEGASFTAPTEIDFGDFSTLTMSTYIDDWSTQGGAKEINLSFRNNGVLVGNAVKLSAFIRIGDFNVWQSVIVAKTEFGIDTETVDEFRVEVEDVGAGDPPSIFLDLIQIEETGTPIVFGITPPPGFQFVVWMVGSISLGPANGVTSIDNFPSDRFFSIPQLANGLVTRITIDGVPFDGGVIRKNIDLGEVPNLDYTQVSTNIAQDSVWIKHKFDVLRGAVLKSSTGDKIEQIVNDDLTAFDEFRWTAIVDLQVEPV